MVRRIRGHRVSYCGRSADVVGSDSAAGVVGAAGLVGPGGCPAGRLGVLQDPTPCGDVAVAGLNESLLTEAAAAKLLRTDKVRADTTVCPIRLIRVCWSRRSAPCPTVAGIKSATARPHAGARQAAFGGGGEFTPLPPSCGYAASSNAARR